MAFPGYPMPFCGASVLREYDLRQSVGKESGHGPPRLGGQCLATPSLPTTRAEDSDVRDVGCDPRTRAVGDDAGLTTGLGAHGDMITTAEGHGRAEGAQGAVLRSEDSQWIGAVVESVTCLPLDSPETVTPMVKVIVEQRTVTFVMLAVTPEPEPLETVQV